MPPSDMLLLPLCSWERRRNREGAGTFILPKCSGTALLLLLLSLILVLFGTNLLTFFPGRDQCG